jgi:transcriptional regulator with XRE-family HTH domain
MFLSSPEIGTTYQHLCSRGVVSRPRVTITAEWRERMYAARKAQGIRQHELAAKFKVTQATISEIEKGKTHVSRLVMPICRELKIAPPVVDVDEDQDQDVEEVEFFSRWQRLGDVLRERSPDLAEQVLALAESMAEKIEKK